MKKNKYNENTTKLTQNEKNKVKLGLQRILSQGEFFNNLAYKHLKLINK